MQIQGTAEGSSLTLSPYGRSIGGREMFVRVKKDGGKVSLLVKRDDLKEMFIEEVLGNGELVYKRDEDEVAERHTVEQCWDTLKIKDSRVGVATTIYTDHAYERCIENAKDWLDRAEAVKKFQAHSMLPEVAGTVIEATLKLDGVESRGRLVRDAFGRWAGATRQADGVWISHTQVAPTWITGFTVVLEGEA